MNTLFHFIRDAHVLALVDVAVAKESSSLNLSHSHLTEVPSNLGACTALTKLLLHCNAIQQLPAFVVHLNHLATLTLDYNSLDHFPPLVCTLRSLTNLNISCNEVRRIPSEIGQLINLEVFWCNNTGISEIPEEIGQCIYLHTLGARGNCIKELPESVAGLTHLRWLTLENNKIARLPDNLAGMCALTHLNVKNNCLTEVPPELANLDALRFCYLNSNAIRDVSDWHLSSTAHMRLLNIDDNPFPDDHLRFEDYPHVVCGSLRNRGKPMAAQLAVAPDRPPVAGDQEPNANNVDDDQMDDNSQVSSSDEDWEHSVATSAIDPSDESSEAHNEDVDDEVDYSKMLLEVSRFASTCN